MLRRTAAKAFGPEQKEETRAETAQPAGATRGKASGKPKVPGKPKALGKRQEAVEHLFGDLRTILQKAIAKGAAGKLRISNPGLLAEGVGFDLEGPGGVFRFLNSVTGQIRVGRSDRTPCHGEVEPDAILSVQLRGGAYRPIWKPLLFRAGGEGAPVQLRTAFRFTSPRELARQYLSRLAGRDPRRRYQQS
jgi:hypothetical protein